MGDKYDEIESECGHDECSAMTRAAERLFDLASDDMRFAELLFDLAHEAGHDGDMEGAVNAVCHHVVMGSLRAAVDEGDTDGLMSLSPQMLQDIGNAIRREGIVQEALSGVPRGEPHNN